MPERMLRRVVASGKGTGEHPAGSFRTTSDNDACLQAKLNFEAAPILKKLIAAPGWHYEVVERTSIEGEA
jgi:hypothetical protein